MEIVMKKIDELIPYENNPRYNEEAVDYVANSIREFGFKVPCVIDKYNVLITGHTRLSASKKLGLKEVPCIVADDLTDKQVKALRLADNKVSEQATWDFTKLDKELEAIADLGGADIDMSMFDFQPIDIDIEASVEDTEPEIESEPEEEIICPHCGKSFRR